ncbi:MAG: cobalamin B12-binding domain-containing protein [Deltaproteobacteria bacterium]|nr:cobalamin B12-binding domain-containing protein [Deltaproteobacteria bacterium]
MHALLVGSELEENLALRYLAASLERAGHTARIAPFATPDDTAAVLGALAEGPPGLVGLSMTFQRRAHEFGALAERIRGEGFSGPIVAGGHFPTFAYRAILDRYPSIDAIVRHEGEETLPEYCGAVAAGATTSRLGEVRGIAYRDRSGVITTPARCLAADLDSLPFPKRTGPPQVHLGIPTSFVVGSRGCYGHCTFCCIKAYVREAKGEVYRARSVDNVADEIAMLRHSHGSRLLIFHDDDFFTRDAEHDLARVTGLAEALERRGVDDIALVVKARPDDVDSRVFDALRRIGLLRVYLGVESGSTQGLRTLGRGVNLEANRRALRYLRDQDVYTCFNMLIFDPDSTIASLRESLGFLREFADVPMNFCRTEIYVGTPLERRLQREGRLWGDEFGWDYEIDDAASERVFRVFARAFLDRNFRCDGLMNSNLGVGYHLHLLRHFYPHAYGPSLRARAIEMIRKVNLDCVGRMERIVEFATSPRAEDADALAEFAEKLTVETIRANEALEEEVRSVSDMLAGSARTRQVRPAPARWRQVAAALAFAPLACTSVKACGGTDMPPPPPDPLPPPQTDGGRAPFMPLPPDPLPPPVDGGGVHLVPIPTPADGGRFLLPTDPLPPPPDPLPPPEDRVRRHPIPVDPPPPPHDPLPPPDDRVRRRFVPTYPPPDMVPPPPPPPPDPLPPPESRSRPLVIPVDPPARPPAPVPPRKK